MFSLFILCPIFEIYLHHRWLCLEGDHLGRQWLLMLPIRRLNWKSRYSFGTLKFACLLTRSIIIGNFCHLPNLIHVLLLLMMMMMAISALLLSDCLFAVSTSQTRSCQKMLLQQQMQKTRCLMPISAFMQSLFRSFGFF